MIDSGYPSAKVDEVMKDIQELPPELVESYYDMVRESMKKRLKNDGDWIDIKKNGKGNYEHLDKL